MFERQMFFHREGDSVWHAFREGSSAALCGESQITWNIDRIEDTLAPDQPLHFRCKVALGLAKDYDDPEAT